MSRFYFYLPSREAELNEGCWRTVQGHWTAGSQFILQSFAAASSKWWPKYLLGSQAMLLLAVLPAPTLTGETWTGVGFLLITSGTVDSLYLLLCKVRYSSGYFRGKKSKPGSLKDSCSCHWICPFCVSCKIAQTDPREDSVLSVLYHNQYLIHKEEWYNNKHNKLVFRFLGVTVLKYIIIPLADYYSNIPMTVIA